MSRLLATLHLGGIAFLIAVVLGSVIWVSIEHNRLAQTASERLVRGAVGALRGKVDTLVRDYSVWDEAYAAAQTGDIDWLYRNIGNAAAEIGTLDLIAFVVPETGATMGWREDTPPAGEADLLPPDLLGELFAMLDGPAPARAMFKAFDGEVWAFSVAEVRPVTGAPEGSGEPPKQIHGLRLTQERLDEFTQRSLIEGGVTLQASPASAEASLPLIDGSGEVISYLTWAPPRPGARILRRLAFPLFLALTFAGGVTLFSARYAIGSAQRLEHALYAARAADRMKTEFLSNVTHELRTPMNGVIGVAQLLEMSDLDAEQRELVGVLGASARTQMSLITDLLDIARLEGGHAELATAPFAPAAALDEIATMIRSGLVQKGVDFEANWDQLAGLTLLGDARAFRQIVTNLLGNAAKFTLEGRVSLLAALRRASGGVEISVEVADTGVGIPEADLERIFERFHRVDGSLTRSTDGTGLGLAISQQLAQLMGARIEVRSRLGEGSTFRFRVTLPEAETAAVDRDAA